MATEDLYTKAKVRSAIRSLEDTVEHLQSQFYALGLHLGIKTEIDGPGVKWIYDIIPKEGRKSDETDRLG